MLDGAIDGPSEEPLSQSIKRTVTTTLIHCLNLSLSPPSLLYVFLHPLGDAFSLSHVLRWTGDRGYGTGALAAAVDRPRAAGDGAFSLSRAHRSMDLPSSWQTDPAGKTHSRVDPALLHCDLIPDTTYSTPPSPPLPPRAVAPPPRSTSPIHHYKPPATRFVSPSTPSMPVCVHERKLSVVQN
jgi:hypothetical protein